MIKEKVFVAINDKDEVQWVQGSSQKTRYFKTDRYLKQAVKYHNTYHTDKWRIAECKLSKVKIIEVKGIDEYELP